MKTLRFKHNENHKLFADSFMYVAKADPKKYPINHGYKVYLDGKYLGEAKMIERKLVEVNNLSQSLAYMVSGFGLKVLKASLCKSSKPASEDMKVYVICFKYLKKAFRIQLKAPVYA